MAYRILRDFTAFKREYRANRDGTLTPLDIEGWDTSKDAAEAKLSELIIRGWIERETSYEALEADLPEEILPGVV